MFRYLYAWKLLDVMDTLFLISMEFDEDELLWYECHQFTWLFAIRPSKTSKAKACTVYTGSPMHAWEEARWDYVRQDRQNDIAHDKHTITWNPVLHSTHMIKQMFNSLHRGLHNFFSWSHDTRNEIFCTC